MINMGAIMTGIVQKLLTKLVSFQVISTIIFIWKFKTKKASLVEMDQPVSSRYNVFKEKYDMLSGGRKNTTSDVSVYKSELEVGFKNKSAINYMME